MTQLKWSDLDLPRQTANLSDTKAGQSIRPLCDEAIKIIEAQPRQNEYVFNYRGAPITHLNQYWNKLAMPKDVSPHSLRHSYASLAGDLGLSDHVIARLLGHTQKSVTSRYIHLDKMLIESANKVAGKTLRLMSGEVR